ETACRACLVKRNGKECGGLWKIWTKNTGASWPCTISTILPPERSQESPAALKERSNRGCIQRERSWKRASRTTEAAERFWKRYHMQNKEEEGRKGHFPWRQYEKKIGSKNRRVVP